MKRQIFTVALRISSPLGTHTSILPYQAQPVVKLIVIIYVKEAVSLFLSFVYHKNIFLRLNK